MAEAREKLFDQYCALGTPGDERDTGAPFAWRRYVQLCCHLFLETAMFAVSTVLITLGLPLFVFLTASGWDLPGLFTHLDNLSTRYLEADAARRLVFSHDLKMIFALAALLVAAVRMPFFVQNIMRAFPERRET